MKKIVPILLSMITAASVLGGCTSDNTGSESTASVNETSVETVSEEPIEATPLATTSTSKTPKYVFLFIGDGMSYPQIQSTADYLGALKDTDYFQAQPSLDDNKGAKLDGPSYLNFMNFDVAGSAVTFDSNSFAPDSASTATSIATGHKTYSGTINMSEDYKTAYETIAEQVHEQKGMSVGVISSVNLNHATPAAFYAHQASRSNYYEIGLELIDSGFEYFAGGGLLKPTGSDGKLTCTRWQKTQATMSSRPRMRLKKSRKVLSSSLTNTSLTAMQWPTNWTVPTICGRWPITLKKALKSWKTTKMASS